MEYSIVFNWLLSTSIKASILIGVIIFIKRIFKNKFGANWHYYIWFLLLLRLVIPHGIKSHISIFNIFSTNTNMGLLGKDIVTYNPQVIISWFNQNVDLFKVEKLTNNQSIFTEYMNILNNNIASKFMFIWLIGVILLLLHTTVTNFKFCLNIKKDSVCTDDKIIKILKSCKFKMHIHKSLPLVKTRRIKSPSLFGLFHPRLLMPVDIDKNLSTNELQYIILHELAHFKRKDIAVCWLSAFLQIIHWFNPIIWYGFYQMRHDREIACDALALSYIEDEECRNYGQTIIHLLEYMRKISQPTGMLCVLNTKSQLKRRIKMITLFNKSTYKLSIVSIVILIIIGFTFLTNATEINTTQKNDKEANEAVIINQVNNEQESTTIDSLSEKGENKLIKMVWPVPDYNIITSFYGKKIHPKLNIEKMHTGIDIAAPKGKSIVSAKEGTVIHSGELGGYGNALIIDHGNGIATMYGHCSELLVKKDTKVKMGEIIAKIGSTGKSTGPHLHFEVRKDEKAVDPLEYVPHDEI